jgi:hypothetical protein
MAKPNGAASAGPDTGSNGTGTGSGTVVRHELLYHFRDQLIQLTLDMRDDSELDPDDSDGEQFDGHSYSYGGRGRDKCEGGWSNKEASHDTAETNSSNSSSSSGRNNGSSVRGGHILSTSDWRPAPSLQGIVRVFPFLYFHVLCIGSTSTGEAKAATPISGLEHSIGEASSTSVPYVKDETITPPEIEPPFGAQCMEPSKATLNKRKRSS